MITVTFMTIGGYEIICPQQKIIALGRRDDANHQQIDIDFAELGEHGVSRLHAFIFIDEDAIYIRDFNSRNGTYLNQQKLIPLKQYALQNGDGIRLGRIALDVRLSPQD